jgi:hypothetical protein
VLALFTTGPVGVSDALGFANATLLNRTVAQSGLLLQPSKPATSTDSTIALSADDYDAKGYVFASFSGPPSSAAAEIQSTATTSGKKDTSVTLKNSNSSSSTNLLLSTPSVVWAYYVISFKLPQPVPVPASDLWPPIPVGTSALLHRAFSTSHAALAAACVNGTSAVASGCVQQSAVSSSSSSSSASSTLAAAAAAASAAVFTAPASDHSNVTGGTDYAPNVETLWPVSVSACRKDGGE